MNQEMEPKNEASRKGNGISVLPFVIFVAIYLFSGIILHLRGVELAFYQFPAPVAVSIGIICAFILTKGSVDEKFNTFIQGCGDSNIITMCIILLLAGGFSATAKAMGGVDAAVNLGLTLIPAQFITAGIFLICAFISVATGTSVGTVVAIGPVAVELAQTGGLNLAMVLGALVGGAIFGDNLSIISDTTIAATRTMDVSMKDKFRVNSSFAIPAALVTAILFLALGRPIHPVEAIERSFDLIKLIPYIFVLLASILGMNVLMVLTGGITIAGVIGLMYQQFTLLELAQQIYAGFGQMNDIFLLCFLTGGLAALVSAGGGIDWLLSKIRGLIRGKISAQLGIATLTAVTDMATANNTVSIVIIAPIAREIAAENGIDPRKVASIMDTFSNILQGLIPYGAQLLIAGSFTSGLISPVQIVPYVWYCFIVAVCALVPIMTPFGNGYINRHPMGAVQADSDAVQDL